MLSSYPRIKLTLTYFSALFIFSKYIRVDSNVAIDFTTSKHQSYYPHIVYFLILLFSLNYYSIDTFNPVSLAICYTHTMLQNLTEHFSAFDFIRNLSVISIILHHVRLSANIVYLPQFFIYFVQRSFCRMGTHQIRASTLQSISPILDLSKHTVCAKN